MSLLALFGESNKDRHEEKKMPQIVRREEDRQRAWKTEIDSFIASDREQERKIEIDRWTVVLLVTESKIERQR